MKWKCELCNYIFIIKKNEDIKSKHIREEHKCDMFYHTTSDKNNCNQCREIFMRIAKTL